MGRCSSAAKETQRKAACFEESVQPKAQFLQTKTVGMERVAILMKQFHPAHLHRLSAEPHSLALHAQIHEAAALADLVGGEIRLA